MIPRAKCISVVAKEIKWFWIDLSEAHFLKDKHDCAKYFQNVCY